MAPLTISNRTGDGINDTAIACNIELPDSGQSITIGGAVQAVGQSAFVITGSPLTAPTVPGSGTTYWNIQVDTTSGAATVQQSSSGDPAPINANNVVVFRQSLASGSTTDEALQATDSTPDQPI